MSIASGESEIEQISLHFLDASEHRNMSERS
jgi:hypothetical protein